MRCDDADKIAGWVLLGGRHWICYATGDSSEIRRRCSRAHPWRLAAHRC